MPMISVVIPTYNGAQFLGAALDSVYAQTFTDYEVIVVDDGSTDNTRDVLEPYRDRVRYRYQENQGLAVARNTGLGLARGDYITYLDADDLWEPENLQVKHQVLAKFPDVGGVFSEFSIFDITGERHSRGTKHLFPFFNRTGRDYPDIFQERHALSATVGDVTVYVGDVFDSLFLGNFILPTSMVVNRAFVLKVGEFRPHMRTQQDYEYWLRFTRQYRLAFVDHVLVHYRRHPQQLTDYSKIERILHAVDEIINAYETEFRINGRGRVFGRRKAELLANLAKVRIRQERNSEARSLIARGLAWDPLYLPTYALFPLSFLPYRLLARVRSMLGPPS